MAVYKPTYTDPKTGETKQQAVWWVNFTFAGKRIQESTKSTRKTIAVEYEKQRRRDLEKALAGMAAEAPSERIRSVSDVLKPYVATHHLNHRPSATAFAKSACKNVERLLGLVLLPDLTEDRIKTYIADRLKEEAAGRTINAELGELSRAIGRTWRELWPRVKKLEERREVGRALSADEEARLLKAADANRSPNVRTMVRVSLLTGFRAGELCALTWGQVDFAQRVLTVGRAKTAAGTGRQVPMNRDLLEVLKAHTEWFTERFGATEPGHYVFPWGSPYPSDPNRSTVELKTAWDSVRKKASVECRWHDLRHTVCTKMAEAGVPESTMLAIMGHMSRAMLERYSHIRMHAKREAVEALNLTPAKPNLNEAAKVSAKVSTSATLN